MCTGLEAFANEPSPNDQLKTSSPEPPLALASNSTALPLYAGPFSKEADSAGATPGETNTVVETSPTSYSSSVTCRLTTNVPGPRNVYEALTRKLPLPPATVASTWTKSGKENTALRRVSLLPP